MELHPGRGGHGGRAGVHLHRGRVGHAGFVDLPLQAEAGGGSVFSRMGAVREANKSGTCHRRAGRARPKAVGVQLGVEAHSTPVGVESRGGAPPL